MKVTLEPFFRALGALAKALRLPKASPPQGAPESQGAPLPAGAALSQGAPESAAPSLDALVQGNSAFAWNLYRVLGREKGNLLFSPISLSEALALAQPGAQGETRAQIDAVARFPKGVGNLNAVFQNLESALTELAGQDIALNLANSLWADKSLQPLESYLANFRDDRASCFQVDFRGDPVGAKDSVNEWVSGQTQDKINDLIRSVRPDTLLVLVNAVYFKGKWNNPFNPEATKDDLFYPVPRSPGVKVPFMWKSSSFNYFQAKGAQIVELFYGEERAFSLALILPKDAPGALKSLEKKLDQALWESWRQGLKPQRLVLGLPKFKITWESPSLVGPLRELGMELPFGDAADFGGIAEAANLKITDVIQKAFIQVEEEGAEAAAATGVGGLIAMAGPPEPKPPLVLVNRPFLFLIKDNQTQSVLFMGRLNDPS